MSSPPLLSLTRPRQEKRVPSGVSGTPQSEELRFNLISNFCAIPKNYQKNLSAEERTYEWLLEHTVEQYNYIYGILALASQDNPQWEAMTKSEVENYGFPSQVQFKWKNVVSKKTEFVNAKEYCERTLLWAESLIFDTKYFPQETHEPIPENYKDTLRAIFKKLFRVFAILICCPCLYSKVDQEECQRAFKSFLYFVWYHELLNGADTDIPPLNETIQTIFDDYSTDFRFADF